MKLPDEVAVSVIISTYNRPEMLDRALESVCAQTYTDFDVWVIDDFSDDEKAIEAVLSKWDGLFGDRGITLWPARMPFNTGYQCAPKNAGILYSNGAFIAYLDDDNTWHPDHLEKLVEAILNGEHDMVYGGHTYVNETDNSDLPVGNSPAQPWDTCKLRVENYIDTSDILHTRGGAWILLRDWRYIWDETMRRFGDWNFVLRWASADLTAAPVDRILSTYYWHGSNLQLTRKPREAPMIMSVDSYRKIKEDQ